MNVVLVLAVLVAGSLLAPAAEASVNPWATRNASWAPAPGDGHGFALRVSTDGQAPLTGTAASVSWSPDLGTTVNALGTFSFATYVETGGCAAGAPRLQFRLDTNGDGATDRFVQAYPAALFGGGCPAGAWQGHDLLDADARWSVPGVGTVSPSAALAALAALPHQVVRVDLQWDANNVFGPSLLWFDDVQLGAHTLSEPVGTELWCPILPDGTGACPFRIG